MRGQPKLIQRPDSPYWFIYIPQSRESRAQRFSTGEEDYCQAEKVFGQWLLERRKPELTPLEEVRVIDMLERYAEAKKGNATIWYNLKHLRGFFYTMRMSHICNPIVREYIAKRLDEHAVRGKQKAKRKVSASTVRRELDTLMAAFNFAKAEGYIKEVPHVEKPLASVPRERWLSYEDFGKLIAAASGNQNLSDFLEIMIGTEARPSFVCSLTWFQIDFDKRIIDFNPAGRRQNNKHRPSVSMNTRLYACLQKRKKKSKSEYVFPGRKGKPVGSFKKSFGDACKAARLTGVTPYTLRHTAITWAVREGHGLAQAGQMAGHKDPRTTMRYAKHDPSFTKGVADTLSTGAQLAHNYAEKIRKAQKVAKKKEKKQ